MATKLIPVTPIDIQTHSDRSQCAVGKLALIGGKMIQSSFPKQVMMTDHEKELKAKAKEAQAKHSGASRVRSLLRSAGTGLAQIEKAKPKAVNQGWNFRTLRSAKTTMTMLDLSAITDRVEQNDDVHVAYLVLSYPKLMITDAVSVHENIARFLRGARKVVGDELADVWGIEFKRSTQAHINLVAALTESEAYALRKLWAKIAGWSGDFKLKDAAFLSMSTSYEERTRSARFLVEKALGYFVLIGNGPKAIRKKHQYKTPESWKQGSGAMWGYSRTIKKAETVQFEITNVKQRRCMDSYLRAHLGIPSKVVRWAYDDTGEVSEPYDLAPFSPDRIYGSRWGCLITPQMVADIRFIIKSLA